MALRKQNLFLFYEKSSKDRWRKSKIWDTHEMLVRTYMNRFVIDEEAQSEVVGVY